MIVDSRFCGPPGSANGGYFAGRLAGERPMEVSLRAPIPLGQPLRIARAALEGAVVYYGNEEIARAVPSLLSLEVPPPVTLDEAVDASSRFPYALDGHAFPRCFGCGPERAPGDGLRIFAGPVAGRDDVYAAPWTPDPSFAGEDGIAVRPEFVWAALDCSGGCRVANPRSTPPVVLGRLAARLLRPVRCGEPHVVIAWPLERDGRKRGAGTAIHTADGELCAYARALWIELRDG